MSHLKSFLVHRYLLFLRKYENYQFDRYRKHYGSFSFNYKKKLANKWLMQYPEQIHFDFIPIIYWFENVVSKPANVMEIGGWKGDLAERALSSNEHIGLWHNYDLIQYNKEHKCTDPRYELITLEDYIWNIPMKFKYNALIATHMIEHINWKEFTELARWIPESVETVLFEAPIPMSHENINWKGDHSSHVLEKGWEQVIAEMKNQRFMVEYIENNSVIFKR